MINGAAMNKLMLLLSVGLLGCHIRDWSDSDSGVYRYESSGWWGSERVEALGDVEFNNDGTDVASISPGGYLRIEKRSWLREQSYMVKSLEDGRLEKTLTMQRQQVPMDESAERWVEEMINLIQQKTPIGTKARAQRLYRERGVYALVDEVRLLESNQAKRAILHRGIELAVADSQPVLPLIVAAGRTIESSSTLSDFLIDAVRMVPEDSLLTEAVFDVCADIESNTQRSETILELVRMLRIHSTAVDELLDAVDQMASSTKKAETLRGILPVLRPHRDRISHLMRVIGNIESNTQQADVWMDFLRQDSLTVDEYVHIARTADRMESNTQRSMVLSALVRRCPLDESIMESVLRTVENMESSSAQEDVLTTLLERPGLTKSILLRIEQTCNTVASQSAQSRIQQMITQRMAELAS
jgi:hypothetical protein